LRSYRAERLSEFVGHVIDGNADAAKGISSDLKQYPLRITRDIQAARGWLRSKKRGQERIGLLASSNALRLKPHGVFVKAAIEPTKWFLSPADDIRSSDALEDAATEFDIQGLEIDWACVCWDANLRFESAGWKPYPFKGSEWQSVNDPARVQFVLNSYRVLLTRARQGLVVFVPPGEDEDKTRSSDFYDGVFNFLKSSGFNRI
jgi:DNA-binding transcriptional LysR family regulator